MPSFTRNDIQQTLILLRNSTEEDDIIAALDILGALQWVGAVPDIMAHIKDPRPDVKASIEATLLAIGQEAIPAIVDYLPKLEPQYHVSLQSLVESFWKDASVDQIRIMMNHEDNRVRWAMAWTLAKPLQTIPPEDIAYIFEGLEDESLTAIRWAATHSLMTLASSGHDIPPQLIQVALPVMVDNFKYGDMNLSESSVQAISRLISPPHPAIEAMLRSSDADLQVAAIKVLSAWLQDEKELDESTLNALKFTIANPTWRAANEISRLQYVLSMSHPEVLKQLDDVADSGDFEDELEDTDSKISTQEIMLPPLQEDMETDPVADEEPVADDTVDLEKTTALATDQPDTDATNDEESVAEDTVALEKTSALATDQPAIDGTDDEEPVAEDNVDLEKTTAFKEDTSESDQTVEDSDDTNQTATPSPDETESSDAVGYKPDTDTNSVDQDAVDKKTEDE